MPILDSLYSNDLDVAAKAAREFFGTDSCAYEQLVDPNQFEPRIEFASYEGDEGDEPISIVRKVPSPADLALSQLRQIKGWPANWDGEEAPRPNPANVDRAIYLLSLAAQKQLAFSVGLDSESSPMLSLRDRLYEGHILIEADGRISFYFRSDEGELYDYDLEFDGRTLPVSLENAFNTI